MSPHSHSHSDRLLFIRNSERRTSDTKLLSGLEFIASKALSGSRGRGWAYEIGPISASPPFITTKGENLPWEFSSWIRFYRTKPASTDPILSASREASQREEIYQFAAAAGHNIKFGRNPWVCKLPEVSNLSLFRATGEEKGNVEREGEGKALVIDPPTDSSSDSSTAPVIDPIIDSPSNIPLSSITRITPGSVYDHLFGLDPQIRILLSAIQAAADSDMRNRFHSLLHGEPGCGKTDILMSTASLLDSLGISYLSIDATSTTEAGMRKLLLDEDEILPEIILVEEIEKARHSFHLLLGIMDDRGTVSQMNYRRTASRKVPALVLASANDYELLQRTDSGALLSRFSNEIYCPRPDRDILYKILKREIEKVKGGDLSWIEPALEFCHDQRGITDPRTIKRICLCGKERLISGEYQRDLEQTMRLEKDINVSEFT